jgi:hypothetical protein
MARLEPATVWLGVLTKCHNPPWVRSLLPCTEPAFDISVSSREIDAQVNRRVRLGEPLYQIHTDLIRLDETSRCHPATGAGRPL